MPLLLESLQNFLKAKPTNDLLTRVLARLPSLEVQVNVVEGEPVDGKRNTYRDGTTEYWGIRIPKHADCDPEFRDYEIAWPLDLYADRIGSTGWDWRERVSWWVGFDVDSPETHAIGSTDLDAVIAAAKRLPYIEIRHSTRGTGLHLYVSLDGIPTVNHTEHATLARTVLQKMEADSGFKFSEHIDVCGGNMWVWSRVEYPNGFKLVSPSSVLLSEYKEDTDHTNQLPKDWRDSIVPRDTGVPRQHYKDCCQLLSESQKALVDELASSHYSVVWQPEKACLHTHTCAIKDAHTALGLRGVFDTISHGEHPREPNCYAYPLDDDAWRVVRFSPGTTEAGNWTQDGTGWTWCDLNKVAKLHEAVRAHGGVEVPKNGGYIFQSTDDAVRAIAAMGLSVEIPAELYGRKIRLEKQKDERIIVAIERQDADAIPAGWIAEKTKWFEQILGEKPEVQIDPDERVRDTLDESKHSMGWFILTRKGWAPSDRNGVKEYLFKLLHSRDLATETMGQCKMEPWTMVDIPFQPEHLPDRQWNYQSAQYRVQPAAYAGSHPTWDLILGHTFAGLNEALATDDWARTNNIQTGREYAQLWLACMFQRPFGRVPYLFLCGRQGTGKSTFHMAIRHLITANGIVDGTSFMAGKDIFNGPLKKAVLVYIEEFDFSKSAHARNQMKVWTGNDYIPVRGMRTDTIYVPNKLHVVQTANSMGAAPFSNDKDTRITLTYVEQFEGKPIFQDVINAKLQAEAPYFMRTIMGLTLPPPSDRFLIPQIDTDHKRGVEQTKETFMQRFIRECCTEVNGQHVLFSEFKKRYREWAKDQMDFDGNSSAVYISNQLPVEYPYSVPKKSGPQIVSNLVWKEKCTDR
jgi:hypothetical protein